MKLGKILLVTCGIAALCAMPSHAGSFGLYGSYWDTKDLDHAFGGGIKTAFDLGPVVDLDLAATYFNNLSKSDVFKIHAAPLDVGLSFHVPTDSGVRPYVGGGASYYLLGSNHGSISDEVGWYGKAGLEIGPRANSGAHFFAEVNYRDVSGTVKNTEHNLPESVSDKVKLQLRGPGANVGVLWRW